MTPATTVVYVTEPIHAEGIAVLEDAGAEVIRAWELAEADRAAALARTEAVVLRVSRFGADMIAAAPRLKVISRHGVGCDNIDLVAAKAAGVAVAISAGANDGAVAEHTMALMLGAAKRLREMGEITRANWPGRAGRLSADLAGRKALVLGYGRIGRRVAPLCHAFGMEVILHDIRLTGAEKDGFAIAPSLAEGLSGAGVLTVHVPLDAETRGMIGAAELALMAPGAIVVNAARGGIIDEAALAAAVRSGHVMGAATDVFGEEPATAENPLLALDDAILTPHSAAMSPESMRLMAVFAARNALAGVAGTLDPQFVFKS